MSERDRALADLRTFVAARMSPVSIASLLDRTLGWVLRETEALAGASPATPALPRPVAADLRIVCANRAQPVTRRTVRFIRAFLVAGWSTTLTAKLFDLDEAELAHALEADAA
jgi:hypothetical protein